MIAVEQPLWLARGGGVQPRSQCGDGGGCSLAHSCPAPVVMAGAVQLFVKWDGERSVPLMVRRTDSVADVRRALCEQLARPAADVRLHFAGRELSDDRSVQECGLRVRIACRCCFAGLRRVCVASLTGRCAPAVLPLALALAAAPLTVARVAQWGSTLFASTRLRGGQSPFDLSTIIAVLIILAVVIFVIYKIVQYTLMASEWLWDHVFGPPLTWLYMWCFSPLGRITRNSTYRLKQCCFGCSDRSRKYFNPSLRV